MKGNIDLTDGRDFPDQRPDTRDVLFGTGRKSLPEWAVSFRLNLVPWELHKISSDDDFLYESNFDPIFPTGSSADIRHKIGVMTAVSDEHCDRCGQIIKRVPWDNRWGLCARCNKLLEEEVGGTRTREMPWERNPNNITIGDLI